MRKSTWWEALPPNDSVEREVWDARAAFLDSLFYNHSGEEVPDDRIHSEGGREKAAFLDTLLSDYPRKEA